MLSIVAAGKNKLRSRLEEPPQKKQKVQEPKLTSTMMKFKDLPRELKQRVASFLPHSDLMNLFATSESIRSDLDLEIKISPLTDRSSQSQQYQTSFHRKCFAVVLPKPEARIHSMTFTCLAEANRANARVWIVEQDVPANQNPENLKLGRFCDSNVIVTSLPLNTRRTLSLTFPVKPNRMYQFYILTQGSGRSVHFSNMCLDRVGFGSKSTEFISYQYDAYDEAYHFDDFDVMR